MANDRYKRGKALLDSINPENARRGLRPQRTQRGAENAVFWKIGSPAALTRSIVVTEMYNTFGKIV
jgi:hypothetical protein